MILSQAEHGLADRGEQEIRADERERIARVFEHLRDHPSEFASLADRRGRVPLTFTEAAMIARRDPGLTA